MIHETNHAGCFVAVLCHDEPKDYIRDCDEFMSMMKGWKAMP